MRKPTSSSPGPSTVAPGPVVNCSTGTVRSPRAPAITQRAPTAHSAGPVSAAGEALHRLPPTEARPWIWVDPIRSIDSTSPGHSRATSRDSTIAAAGTAAPSQSSSSPSSSRVVSGMRFTSTNSRGALRPERSCTRRSVPPASTRAPDSARSSIALASDPGAS